MTIIHYKGEDVEVGDLPENATSEQKRAALFKARPDAEVAYKKYVATKQGAPKPIPAAPLSETESKVAEDVKRINEGQLPISKSANAPRRPEGPRAPMTPQQERASKTGNYGRSETVDRLFKNLGAGAAESIHNAASNLPDISGGMPEREKLLKRYLKPQESEKLKYHLGKQERPDYQQKFGINESNYSPVTQKIPELAAMLLTKRPPLSNLAANVPGVAGGLARTGLNAASEFGTQASLGALFNPEDKMGHAIPQGTYGAGGSVLADALASADPRLRFLKAAVPFAGGGYVGYNLPGEEAPAWKKIGMGTGGALLGLMGPNAIRKLLGGDSGHYARPYAQKIMRTMTPEDAARLSEAEAAGNRAGITSQTLGQKTQNPIHLEGEKKLGTNEVNVQKFRENQEKQVEQMTHSKEATARSHRPTDRQIKDQYAASDKSANAKQVKGSIANTKIGDPRLNKKLIDDPEYLAALKKTYEDTSQVSRYGHEDKFSMARQDKVKRNLDKKIESMEKQIAEKSKDAPSADDVHRVKEVRQALIDTLDETSKGEYKLARELYEKKVWADKVHNSSIEEFRKLLSNPKSFKDLKDTVKGNKFLEQRYDDLRLIFQNVKSIDVNKMAKALPKTTFSSALTNPIESGKALARRMLDGSYEKAALSLSLNPRAARELHELSKVSDPAKRAALLVQLAFRYSGNTHAQEPSYKFTKEDYKKMEGTK